MKNTQIKMSDQEINIAIAEACGWVERDEPKGSAAPKTWWHGPHRYPPNLMPVPDYCNDLNAMHEALELISQQCKDSDFWFFLRKIIGFPDAESDWDEYYYFQAINATAHQRAEAFLRTIGKWKEGAK